jgi:topoisomerase IV subunit A
MNVPPPSDEFIESTPLSEALSERYLSYALSTIMSRSLPDVRDGLKPVHRRLLFAMRQLKLDPNSGFKKSARVVGDVMGKFHPHGDQAIYDALVRLAQEFSVRYPLIDGQGNFGNIDGDNPAAMRYTEARLTEVAEALLDGIDEDTVDFRATYDGEEKEPVILPASFPNLLANGATGIAVGMATNIPPHNAAELCTAMLHLIKHPNAGVETIADMVPGPDFPTGGVLIEPRASIVDAYKTGRGGFRLRARWEVENTGRGQYQIVVTEIPYQVQKSKLIEKIADLLNERKVPALADVRDESADDIRLVLEPKSRTIDPAVLMETLFRRTDLETRFPLNLNVLDANQVPRVMSLREALNQFLEHRFVVLRRRSEHRLAQIEHRLEVLSGFLIAYLNLDEIIAIIRNEDHPKPALIKRFKLTDVQAEAILNMRLRQLRKLEEIEIQTEFDALKAEQKGLKALLRDKKKQEKHIADEIRAIRTKFGPDTPLGARRTEIGDAPDVADVPLEAMIEKEPITVVCSRKGWLRAAKGHLESDAEIKFKEGDGARFQLTAQTTDKLVLFATNGRFYTLGCEKLPGGRGHGEPVRLLLGLGDEVDVVAMFIHEAGRKFLVASTDGRGFVTDESGVIGATRNGKQVLNLADGAEATVCRRIEGDTVAVIGQNRKLILFPLDELPEMGRGRGVILQRYKDGELGDAKTFVRKDGLMWQAGGRTRTETDLDRWLGKRAQAGYLPPRGFPKNNRFS